MIGRAVVEVAIGPDNAEDRSGVVGVGLDPGCLRIPDIDGMLGDAGKHASIGCRGQVKGTPHHLEERSGLHVLRRRGVRVRATGVRPCR